MKKLLSLPAVILLFPLVASAQTFQVFLTNSVTFLSNVVIPFLFGIAFLFFVINVFRFFILNGSNQEGQDNAKALATYGVAAFVFLIIFWGIISMLSSSLGLGGYDTPKNDYVEINDGGGSAPSDCTPGVAGAC